MGATIEVLTSLAGTPVARPRRVQVLRRPRRAVADLPRRVRTVSLAFMSLWFPALPVQLALQLGGALNIGVGAMIWTALSAALAYCVRVLARPGRLAVKRLADLALGFHVFAVLSFVPLAQVSPAALCWPAAWTLFFAALVPLSPRRLVLATAGAFGIALLLLAPIDGFPAVLAGAAGITGIAAALALLHRRIPPTSPMPRQLGSYELVRQLGAGGMGEVWLARHARLERPAAVKLLRPETLGVFAPADVAALRTRFEREAQATAMLRSPHTVSLHDFGVAADGTLYYAMELLEGMNLEQLVRRHGPQPAERVAAILVQICESLEEAHRAGLVHRDIKPANLMLSTIGGRPDFAKVLDFGLVKRRNVGMDPRLTQDGTVTGTPGFMAPEIAMNAGDVDGRADLYALGCVAFWLLTGKLVFQASSPMGMAVKHVSMEPPLLSQAIPGIAEDFEAIILDCLAKRPGDRPASAAEVAERLLATGLTSAWTTSRARDWWIGASEGKPAAMAVLEPGRKAA